MIGPSAEQIADMIRLGCDTIEAQVRRNVAAAPGLVDRALDAARVGWPVAVPLPDPVKRILRGLILEAVRECAATIYDALDQFRLLARSVGRPSTLRSAADQLEKSVIARAAALDGHMLLANLKADDRTAWNSLATDSYETAFTEQKSAVGSIDDAARGLRDALRALASDIEEFFDELQFAYLSFAVAVGGLVLAILTAVETLGVGAVIGLIIAVVSLVAGIASLVMAFTGASAHNAETVARLEDAPAFSWPQSAFAS
jgi:hypothetical protein